MRYVKSYIGCESTVLRHKVNKTLFFKHFDPLNSKSYAASQKVEWTGTLPVITTDDVQEAWHEKVYNSSGPDGTLVPYSEHFRMKEDYKDKLEDYEVVFVSTHTERIMNVPD